ncbi:hypothetical protein BGZ96_000779 [Linnemannia gamsii]|uniref:Uncharacterized protein n=1 Tax=Linnemannia gamsii TaxID=64522 RepID=A0ABQ7JNM8_9FUNG|nr:hypothetical protein BGZ96_000779 [Linnemannia gamsii]
MGTSTSINTLNSPVFGQFFRMASSHHHHHRYSTSTTSHDDNKSAYQESMDQSHGWDVYLDYDRQSPPLPTPPLLKDVVAITTVTTASADAVLDQDRPTSSPQQLYQQLLNSSAPPTSSPPLPVQPSWSDEESTKSLLIAPLLPPPVAFLALDQKDDICSEVSEDLDTKDLPLPLPLLPGEQQDAIEQQKQQEPIIITTIKRASTTDTVVDKSFLSGLFAGTLTWWTKPTPALAPVPPITITTSAMASTTSPMLRHMHQGRGQSGDLVDMDPFWDV